MKKIIIAIVVIVVLAGGYLIYQQFFTYEPSYYPISSGEEAQPPSISVTETPSTEAKYAKWLGGWVPEKEFDPSEPFYYLHVELDSSGLPTFDIKILEGFTEKRPLPVLGLVGTLDDSSVKCKFEAEYIPKEVSIEIVLKHNPATDKLEWMGIAYKNDEKIEQEGKTLFIRRERWEELASKELLPGYSSQPGIRNKVSRVKSDMRSMATALEAFYVDNRKYPDPDTNYSVPLSLTKPIAYLSRLFLDPFAQQQGASFHYYTCKGPNEGWVLVSGGPDGDIDLTHEIFSATVKKVGFKGAFNILLGKYGYDPTNGTISNGDILRFRQ